MLAAVVALGGCSAGKPQEKHLRLALAKDRLDLGSASPGEERTATFTLRNDGGDVLHIEKT